MALKYYNIESRRCALQSVTDMLVHIFIVGVILMRRKLMEKRVSPKGWTKNTKTEEAEVSFGWP